VQMICICAHEIIFLFSHFSSHLPYYAVPLNGHALNKDRVIKLLHSCCLEFHLGCYCLQLQRRCVYLLAAAQPIIRHRCLWRSCDFHAVIQCVNTDTVRIILIFQSDILRRNHRMLSSNRRKSCLRRRREHCLVFSERERCCRPPVCRLSVTLVRPTQPVEILGTVSTPFSTLAIH